MSRKLDHLLREWGDWHIKHMDFADEYGSNILYQSGILQGRVQDSPGKDKILCPDTPSHLQAVDIALNRLPEIQQLAVCAFYFAPVKPDGQLFTIQQIAIKAQLSLSEYKNNLRLGKKMLNSIIFA